MNKRTNKTMESKVAWIFIFLSVCSFKEISVKAINCFECEDLFKPYLCDIVTKCAPDQQCFVDEYITSSGNVKYKSGCRSTQRCSITKRELHTTAYFHDVTDDVASDVASDILFCSECCNNTDYCNKEGCKQTVPARDKRGSFCFDCKRQEKNGCRRVTQCDQSEVCEISTEERNGLTLYNSRCVNPLSSKYCNTSSSDPVDILIGKRDESLTSFCPKCCSEDFCNADCNLPSVTDGGWSEWGSWSTCSATCGSGLTRRTRTCSNPPSSTNGHYCDGVSNQTKICIVGRICPAVINGAWSEWGSWSSCSATCDLGLSRRSRTCSNPPPSTNGHHCEGTSKQTKLCDSGSNCPDVGVWGSWTSWSACPVTCGRVDFNKRTRTCISHSCTGASSESKPCGHRKCPLNGGFTEWGRWSRCSVTCGSNGIQLRRRTCSNPPAVNSNQNCSGKLVDARSCDASISCPFLQNVDGGWTTWHNWTPCTGFCVQGYRQRVRTCTNPIPKQGGHTCKGNPLQRQVCNSHKRCKSSGYSSWSSWSSCSASCGYRGITKRTRTCNTGMAGHGNCEGSNEEILPCNELPCH